MKKKFTRLNPFTAIFISVLFCLGLTACETAPVAMDTQAVDESSNAAPADLQQRVKLRMELALAYYQQGVYPVALEEINKVLKLDSSMAAAYGLKALIYMEMKEYKLAQSSFISGLKIQPDNPDLNNNYGWFICQQGFPVQSIPYFENAFKNPAYKMQNIALTNAGRCSFTMNKFDDAEKYLRLALAIDPNNVVTNLYMAKVTYQQNQVKEAKVYIDRIIKQDQLGADALWLALKIEHRVGDPANEAAIASQLGRRFSNSPEYAAYQRGAFNE